MTTLIHYNLHAVPVPDPVLLKILDAQRRNCQRLVRERAYFMWEDAGEPEGRDLEFWLKAERHFQEWTQGVSPS